MVDRKALADARVFVADGIEAGAARCQEILRFGGMGHTAGMHTENRDAAIRYGARMPASRIVINSPTTHGAIGFSTDLPPSMTLGCGSWGGNVTSDNVSPIHLMDIKRVAFETKPVSSAVMKARSVKPTFAPPVAAPRPTVKRDEIAAIVDSFLSKKLAEEAVIEKNELTAHPAPTEVKPEPAMDSPVRTIIHELKPHVPGENGTPPAPVEFVSEDDVRRAIAKGEKIYITAKTILTPSARDLGEEKEIFAKVQ